MPPIAKKVYRASRGFAQIPVFCPEVYGKRQLTRQLVPGGEGRGAKHGTIPGYIDCRGQVNGRAFALRRVGLEAEEMKGEIHRGSVVRLFLGNYPVNRHVCGGG